MVIDVCVSMDGRHLEYMATGQCLKRGMEKGVASVFFHAGSRIAQILAFKKFPVEMPVDYKSAFSWLAV